MVACSRCHFMNPVKQKACQACGATLPYASAPTHERPGQSRPTLRGLRSPEPLQPVAVQEQLPQAFPTSDKTMPSLVGPTPEQIRSHRVSNTLLGHGTPLVEEPAPSSQVRSPASTPSPVLQHQSPPRPPISATASSRSGLSRQATLLGHAPLLEASSRRPSPKKSSTSQTMPSMPAVSVENPTPESANTEDTAEEPPRPEVSAHLGQDVQRVTPRDSPAKTYLGVAAANASEPISGELLVPSSSEPHLNYPALGVPPPLPQVSIAEVPSEEAQRPEASPAHSPRVPTSVVVSRRMVQKRLGRAVLAVTSLLGLGLLTFTWVWKPSPPVVGHINPHTRPPTLELQCDSCPDGSFVHLDGQRGEFIARRATVPLVEPPKVGPNSFNLDVYRSGLGRDEQVELSVDVAYRAVWDLSGLAVHPPHLTIVIEAAPGVLIRVNNNDVAMSGGRGKHWMALSEAPVGPSRSVEWLDESAEIAASFGQKSGPSNPFSIRLPVVPLAIDTPSPSFHTDAKTVVVSGRTAPGALVAANGQYATADEAGYFELTVASHVGLNGVELNSSLGGHVPRTTSVTFSHVDNLTKVALAYQTGAVRRFDHLTQRVGESNSPVRVALAGRVQEWKTSHNVTVALLDVSSGCPNRTCLVRVEHPAAITLSANQAISVFGEASLAIPPQGALPTVQSHFILE